MLDGLFDVLTFNVVSNIPTVCTKMCSVSYSIYYRVKRCTHTYIIYAHLFTVSITLSVFLSLFLIFFLSCTVQKRAVVCISPRQHQIKNGARVIVGGSKNPRRSAPDGRMGNIILVGFILYIRRTGDQ